MPSPGVLGFFLLAACASTGSGGGCSCVKSLPQGFPSSSVIERAATVRVTRPGLDFLASRIASLVARNLQPTGAPYVVDVPATSATGISICSNGANRTASPPECTAEVNFANAAFRIDGATPNKLRIAGTIPLRVQNLRVSAIGFIPFGLGVGSPAACGSGGVPSVSGFTNLQLLINAPLVGSPSTVRGGSTVIDTANAEVTVQIPRSDVVICNSLLPSALTNGILSLAFGTLESTLASAVKDALGEATCQAPNAALTPPCPTGSRPDDPDPTKWSKCVLNANANVCVPSPLGIEGTVDVGSLLSSFAPGTKASLDVLFAARGALDPAPGLAATNSPYPGATPNGLTLSFGGGALPSPVSSCVPMAAPALPTNIPVPDELRRDTVSGIASGPHLGLGVSERFLGYALGQATRSGLLCLDVSGERISLVNTAILSLLAKGLPTLAHEARTSAALVRLRPRGLPTLTLGGGTNAKTDPLLTARVPDLRLEVYAWSYRRWVHAFDLEATVVAKLGLDVVQNATYPKGALQPVIGDVSLEGAKVSGADLLPDDPAVISRNFAGILSLVAGRLGALGAIDLSTALESFGLTLEVPSGGVRRLVKADDRFLGVFLNFGVTTSPRVLPPPSVSASPQGEGRVKLAFEAPLGANREWALSLDGVRRGPWHGAEDQEALLVEDPLLAIDGEHTVGVQVREAGIPATASVAREVPVRVDHEAPFVTLREEGDEAGRLEAWDRVSGERLSVRKTGSAAFVPFDPTFTLAPGESATVRDEAGLERTVLRAPLAESGPACTYAPSSRRSSGTPFAFALVGALGVAIARRRARGGTKTFALLSLAVSAFVAACTKGETKPLTGCGAACNAPCKTELPRGLTGSYLAAAKGTNGTLWFSGYEDSALVGQEEFTYGDWHVGAWNEERGEVAWEAVAGMPAPYTDGRCADRPASGYRAGRFEQGTDVGRSTSIALMPDGTLIGAAYDATARGLVFASRSSSGVWSTHLAVTRPRGDVGRHVRVVVQNGVPWLFYLATEPSGRGLRSSLEVARASSARPSKASDWAIDTVASVAEGPCRQVLCEEGAYCSPTSRRCETVQTSCSACDGGSCVVDQPDAGATCAPSIPQASLETSLPAFGDGFALLAEGANLTFAVNDGTAGQLALLTPEGTGWRKTVVDGDPAQGVVRGVGPSLARASDGTLQLFSFDATSGALTYVNVRGTQVLARGIVDDGSKVGSTTFDDAPHAFGRESAAAYVGGTLTVFYQDAKLGVLRKTTGTPASGGEFRWTLASVPLAEKSAGFFPVPLEDGRVAHFWRRYDRETRTALGGVAVVTP